MKSKDFQLTHEKICILLDEAYTSLIKDETQLISPVLHKPQAQESLPNPIQEPGPSASQYDTTPNKQQQNKKQGSSN